MDYSFWFDTVKLGKSIVHICVRQVIIFKKYSILFSEDLFTLTNSVDPYEMQHSGSSLFAKVLNQWFPEYKGLKGYVYQVYTYIF